MNILITTGGTGGHMFPALQTALALRIRGHQVVFAGALAAGEEQIKAHDFACYRINAAGLNSRSPLGLLRWSATTMQAIMYAQKIIQEIKPQKVLGFGGYGSFPVAMAARIAGVPLMIHEQNVVPGKANRVMALMARRIAITFQVSQKYFKRSKVIWTGCPCHQQVPSKLKIELRTQFGLDPQKPVLLILGGSQGSQRLNSIVFETLMLLGTKVQAIHMTGPKEYPVYVERYGRANLCVKVYAFISPVEEAYATADLVIARAGAATVCELAAFALPSILVPYPFAGGHQKYNAAVLSDAGAAVLKEENALTPAVLKESIEAMLGQPLSPQEIRRKTQSIFLPDPAIRLALALEEL